MRWRTALAALVSAALSGSCASQAAGPGGSGEIDVRVFAADITPTYLNGLKLRGAIELTADHDAFGGFSGLHIDPGHMIAVSDTGWWLLSDLTDTAAGIRPVRNGFVQIRDQRGETYGKIDGDAEGLTMRDGTLVVSFEREHRIMFHKGSGQLENPVTDERFFEFSRNKGLEALATTPDGWILAFGERPRSNAFRVFQLKYSGEVTEGRLPALTRHYLTGADVDRDGRLYVLLRDYIPLLGVSARILRYKLGEDGFPDPDSHEELARLEAPDGIDNMEGLSIWTDAAGKQRLAIISDDNYNAIQRTLLIDFEITD